jgi:hypothetical protein
MFMVSYVKILSSQRKRANLVMAASEGNRRVPAWRRAGTEVLSKWNFVIYATSLLSLKNFILLEQRNDCISNNRRYREPSRTWNTTSMCVCLNAPPVAPV